MASTALIDNQKPSVENERRDAQRWWLLPLVGVTISLLGTVANSDLRYWMLWSGPLITVCGLCGSAFARLGPEVRVGHPPSWVPRLACAAAVLVALIFLRAATSSENGVPSFGTLLVILAPAVLASAVALIATIALRATGTLGRAGTALVTFGVMMCLVASLSFMFSFPLKLRVGAQEKELTQQAETLVHHRELFGVPGSDGRIAPGTLSDPSKVTNIGDFDVSRVDLDDFDLAGCISSPGNGGLRFQLGPANSSTSLIYCPLHDVEPGSIHSGTYHLGGPWYVEYIDD